MPPLIPALHGVEQDDGGQNGLAGGQHDAEQDGHVIGAVDPGGFLQGGGHLGEVVLQHDDVEDADAGGEDHHGHLVDKP